MPHLECGQFTSAVEWSVSAGSDKRLIWVHGMTTLGFACNWDSDPRGTWSHTPWNLREALQSHVNVIDVGLRYSDAARYAFKAAYARRVDNRWVTTWKGAALPGRITETVLKREVRRTKPGALVEIGDMGIVEVPFFVYQDMSYGTLLRHYDRSQGSVPHFPGYGMNALLRGRERQQRVYAAAAGVLTMSHWLARSLIEDGDVAPEKVHVVNPGATAIPLGPAARRTEGFEAAEGRRKLLFVGKDFVTKGGDLAVEALSRLRAEHDPAMTLTVVGPTKWPMPGSPPDGVDFRGRLSVSQMRQVYAAHDLLVLPSRFEGFGIAFVEALAHGVPCIGRDAFAMPEIVRPGDNGALIKSEDPDDLAAAIVDVLGNDGIYFRAHVARENVMSHFSWDRSARETLAAVASAVPAFLDWRTAPSDHASDPAYRLRSSKPAR